MKYDELEKAKESIDSRDLPEALRLVRAFVDDHPQLISCDDLAGIADDFHRMTDYMRQGFSDPSRDELYRRLLRRLWLFVANTEQACKTKDDPLFVTASRNAGRQPLTDEQVKSALEGFVGDLAMVSLDPTINVADLYASHYRLLSRLFDQIVVAPQWHKADSEFYGRLLPSPTIETTDALLLVSAITLACLGQFDINKIATLHTIYLNATDESLRQRALVGFALSLPDDMPMYAGELRTMVNNICSDDGRLREVVDLQKQIALCMNAERDHERIQRDIMPSLIRNNNFSVTRSGIVEKEDDPMDDILGTGNNDRKMEEMEKSIQQMMEMQRAGSDIYFGGFSQMKRSAFFHKLSNWFTPFSVHHPDMRGTISKLGDSKLPTTLQSHGPFCDSDKYSFVIAVATIIDKMPPPMREMLDNAQALNPSDLIQKTDDEQYSSAAYIRRMYLQDLYRFFRLYPQRDSIADPFAAGRPPMVTAAAFRGSAIRAYATDLAVFFHKQRNGAAMGKVLEYCENSSDAQYFMLSGIHLLAYNDEPLLAIARFQVLQSMAEDDNDDEAARCYRRIRPLLGRALMRVHFYDEAIEVYGELYRSYPDNKSYALSYCSALANAEKFDEALSLAYHLDLNHHDDINVIRLLAWTLMGQKKLDEAERHYTRLLAHDKRNAGDYLNAGYCQWFKGDISAATDLFRRFMETYDGDGQPSLDDEFANDADMLRLHCISDTDRRLMKFIVENREE